MFTSTQDLQEAMITEDLELQDARYFILREEDRLKRAAQRHRESLVAVRQRDGHDALKTFLSTTRLWSFIPSLSAFQNSRANLKVAHTSPSSRTWWPTDSDVSGGAAAICRLQRLYNVKVTKMAAMQSPLLEAASPEDLKDVARGCFATGSFGTTSEWAQTALHRCCISYRKPFKLGLRWLVDNDRRWPRILLRKSLKWWKVRTIPYPSPPEADMHKYKHVCVERGDLRPESSRLTCKMSTNSRQPQLLLRPNKMEVLSSNPSIVILHDFLSSSEVRYVRTLARKKSGIYARSQGAILWERNNKVFWVEDSRHAVLQRLTRRIAATSALSTDSAEQYMVGNYGLGGHYTPHMDAHDFDSPASMLSSTHGNRLATVLLYLADVEAVGATAFVNLGLAVRPRAGAALLWRNLVPYEGSESPRHFSFVHQKRKPDARTLHVGCPVLRGSKWVCTKWIRELDNVVVRNDRPD
ncbi:prolyl 4-hydroxylase subunit alpha-3-like [Haemaphysalis longicornis]